VIKAYTMLESQWSSIIELWRVQSDRLGHIPYHVTWRQRVWNSRI